MINHQSHIPLYIQVKETLTRRIERREWKEGDQLPPEQELCELFAVSRVVVRQALKEMEYEGLIFRKQGKGTFVSEPKIRESLVQRLTGFYQDMVDQGYTPVTKVLKQQTVPASPKISADLAVKHQSPVIEIERLRYIQGEPLVLVASYIPYRLCPELLHVNLTNRSLYAFLEKEAGLIITHGRRRIGAAPASHHEARLLNIERGAPLIVLDSISYLEDGTPIECYHALHRADRSSFEVELVRSHHRTVPLQELTTKADLPASSGSVNLPEGDDSA